MGLLTKINLSKLKSEAADLISPTPKVDIDSVKWGSLGDFIFSIYQWSEQFSWKDEDEYIEYKTLAGVVEKQLSVRLNRMCTLNFKLFQRDLNDDSQQEGNVFEEDIMETISLLYKEKNRNIPLDLTKNNGELYMGSFSINEISVNVIEEDSKGLPLKLDVTLELESYPDTQLKNR